MFAISLSLSYLADAYCKPEICLKGIYCTFRILLCYSYYHRLFDFGHKVTGKSQTRNYYSEKISE